MEATNNQDDSTNVDNDNVIIDNSSNNEVEDGEDNEDEPQVLLDKNTSMPDGWQFSRRSKVERLIGGGLEHKYME